MIAVTIYGDHCWHENFCEDGAGRHPAGVAPLYRRSHLARIAIGRNRRADWCERFGPSPGPAFAVRVIVPRMARPFGGILPDGLVKKLDGTPSELRFDHTSNGAQIVSVGPDRLELSADGWELSIETDAERRITQATHLVFPITLGGRQVRLNCRPADSATGYLSTTPRAGSKELAGRFLVELASCKNADSGRSIEWPPRPLTVRGSFAGPAK